MKPAARSSLEPKATISDERRTAIRARAAASAKEYRDSEAYWLDPKNEDGSTMQAEVCANDASVIEDLLTSEATLFDHLATLVQRDARQDAAIMNAIEATVIACDQQERDKIPHEARDIDYAKILRDSKEKAARSSLSETPQ